MSPGDEGMRFRQAWTYLITRNTAVVTALFLAGLVLKGAGNVVGPFVLCVALGVVWTVIGRMTEVTTMRSGAIRGASSTTGIWSTRPPSLAQVENLTTTTRGIGRIVEIAATDGDGIRMHWRLDAPRALRWGNDPEFDAAVELLRRTWAEASPPRVSS